MRRTRLKAISTARAAVSAVFRQLVQLIRPFWKQCARCGIKCQHLEAHHPFKRGKGPMAWKMFIVLPLCQKCHGWVHSHEKQARQDGWLVNPKTVSPYEIALPEQEDGDA